VGLLKPYPPNCAIRSKIAAAFASGFRAPSPARKWAFCLSSGRRPSSHRLPEHVGLAQREARQRLRDLHHLLLVDDDAYVSRGSPSAGMEELHLPLPCRRSTKSSAIRSGAAGAVQGDHVDQVVELVGLRSWRAS